MLDSPLLSLSKEGKNRLKELFRVSIMKTRSSNFIRHLLLVNDDPASLRVCVANEVSHLAFQTAWIIREVTTIVG